MVLKDSNGDAAPDQRYSVNTNNRELSYRFDGLPDDTYYWTLPSRFLGDKVGIPSYYYYNTTFSRFACHLLEARLV